MYTQASSLKKRWGEGYWDFFPPIFRHTLLTMNCRFRQYLKTSPFMYAVVIPKPWNRLEITWAASPGILMETQEYLARAFFLFLHPWQNTIYHWFINGRCPPSLLFCCQPQVEQSPTSFSHLSFCCWTNFKAALWLRTGSYSAFSAFRICSETERHFNRDLDQEEKWSMCWYTELTEIRWKNGCCHKLCSKTMAVAIKADWGLLLYGINSFF